jgi:glycosyltransferase involved in cell wall biosynthesis
VRTRHVSTRIRDNWPTRWLYQRATCHIVTTGEALRAQLIRENGFDAARITSIPTGIDLERFRPRDPLAARRALGLDPARRYLGIVATLRNWKGHAYLLEALATLAPLYPDWDLLIVGDGPQRANLARRIAELGLGGRVYLVGHREDVEQWFNAFDIFVLPSYGEEGLSQSLMQAMASALPAVATAVGAIPEAIAHEQTGLLVPPRDTSALSEALGRLMRDAPLRRRLGEAARLRARERFGLERMLAAMEALFWQVSETRQHPCAA